MKQEIIRIDLGGVNCYLGRGEQGFVLFDTGGPMILDKQLTNRRSQLIQALDKAGCAPGSLNLIVLTHGDCDHSANAACLRERYGAPLAMHSADRCLVENPTLEDWMASFHYSSRLYRLVFRMLGGTIRKATQQALDSFERFAPDILLDSGFNLADYGFDAELVAMPGHTAGSVGVLTGEGDLIAGDTFANMKHPGPAPNAVDFGSLAATIDRVRSLGVRQVYPGHGEPFTMADFNRR